MSKSVKGRPVRVGVVGAGYVSTHHLRALRGVKGVTVVGIADPDRARAEKAAAEFGVPKVFGTLAEMAAERPDAVHILTPPASHCELTLQALEMGCHVLVEKPMALSVEDCDRMIAKAQSAGLALSVNHSARFSPALRRAAEIARGGGLGEVLAVEITRGSSYPPYSGPGIPAHYRDGGYPYRDIGVHGLYLFEEFLGEIEEVRTDFRSSGADPNLLFDEWRSTVRCRKGFGHMYLSWNARPMQNEVHVIGTQGFLRVDLFLETLLMRRNLPGPKAAELIFGNLLWSVKHFWQVGWNTVGFATGRMKPSHDLHDAVAAFATALVNGAEPPVAPEEGRRMVRWVEEAARPADLEKCRLLQPVTRPGRPRALITGAGGFLGGVLLERVLDSLGEGETVRVLARYRPHSKLREDPRVEVIYGDLGDAEAVDRAVAGVDLVYHAGATMNGDWEDFERGTILGTRNVVEACARHAVQRLVYVSSLSVLDYATLADSSVVTESSAVEPRPDERGFYAKSKLEAENVVLDAIRRSKLPVVVLRPGQIFGRGAEMIPPYGTVGLGSRWLIMGNGSLPLPLVYVEDVVDAMLAAGERPDVEGAIVQLVDPKIITQREFASAAAVKLKGRVQVSFAPMWFLRLAAIGLEAVGKALGRRVPLTRYRLRSIKGIRNFDCSAARDLLGWSPRIGAGEGLRKTYLES